MLLAVAVWTVILSLSVAKWFFARVEAWAEWEPPVLCGFAGLAPVTMTLAALALPPDLFAEALLGYGLFQGLILVRLVPWIARQPFTSGYWAFTFGVAALPLAALRMVERGLNSPGFVALAVLLFVVANGVIVGIAVGSLRLLARGRLLPPPLLAPVGVKPSW